MSVGRWSGIRIAVNSQCGISSATNFSLVEEGRHGWMFGYCSVMMGSGRRWFVTRRWWTSA